MPQFYAEDAVASPVTLLASTGAAFAPTALASLTTVNSQTQTNYFAHGLLIVVDITTFTGTAPTFTLTLQGVDATSGKQWTVLASAALTATGTTVLTVYPSVTVTANVSASTTLPYQWRLTYTTGGTAVTNLTATIQAYIIP